MFTDQVPDMQMSPDLAPEHGFKLVPAIREALTLTANASKGPRKLAMDEVASICEHGTRQYNSLGQKMYPRYEFFKQVVDAFRETGQTVPVFIDKHLSYDWNKAKWMHDQSRDLGFPARWTAQLRGLRRDRIVGATVRNEHPLGVQGLESGGPHAALYLLDEDPVGEVQPQIAPCLDHVPGSECGEDLFAQGWFPDFGLWPVVVHEASE